MSKEYSDLLYILADVMRSGADSRLIWCTAADGFETTVSTRRGLILGGAWSPHFLHDRSRLLWDVPWTMHLRAPAIVTIDKATTPISEWLPLIEAVAKSGGSLLLATREVSTELLHTLIVNSSRETLSCCVVHIAEDSTGWSVPGTPWGVVDTAPKKVDGLPRAAEAWIRRTATVLFPLPDSQWLSPNDITVISVGGRDHDDQHDRLRFLVETIQQ